MYLCRSRPKSIRVILRLRETAHRVQRASFVAANVLEGRTLGQYLFPQDVSIVGGRPSRRKASDICASKTRRATRMLRESCQARVRVLSMDSIWDRFFDAGEMIGFVRLLAFLGLYVIGFGLIFALIGA